MPEQIESELFIASDYPILISDGEKIQCIRWTNGNWFAVGEWWDD